MWRVVAESPESHRFRHRLHMGTIRNGSKLHPRVFAGVMVAKSRVAAMIAA